MDYNFEECLDIILELEGGFANHPDDPGGATNFGITKKTYEEWIGEEVTIDDIKNLDIKDVLPIYEEKYWLKTWCDVLPAGIDLTVFDFAVHSGPNRAVRYLQNAVRTESDGILGPITLRAVELSNPFHLIKDYMDLRLEFLSKLSNYNTFKRGWLRRLSIIEHRAFKLAELD